MFKNNFDINLFNNQPQCSSSKFPNELDFLKFVLYHENNFKFTKEQADFLSAKNKIKRVFIKLEELKTYYNIFRVSSKNSDLINLKMVCESVKNNISNDLETLEENTSQYFKTHLRRIINLKNLKQKHSKINNLKILYYNNKKEYTKMRISSWIEKKENEVNSDKDTENFRKHADLILSNVRVKRYDAKKFLTLLQELKKLRKIQMMTKFKKGMTCFEANKLFENLIVKLSRCWINLCKEYRLEELGLNLMIKNDNESIITQRKENSIDNYIMNLFEKKSCRLTKKRITTLISSRKMWDECIDIQKGSKVPCGWINKK